jgi:hypothetical protein
MSYFKDERHPMNGEIVDEAESIVKSKMFHSLT